MDSPEVMQWRKPALEADGRAAKSRGSLSGATLPSVAWEECRRALLTRFEPNHLGEDSDQQGLRRPSRGDIVFGRSTRAFVLDGKLRDNPG
jgi:hypothetical protein